jgi:hypothetical protein
MWHGSQTAIHPATPHLAGAEHERSFRDIEPDTRIDEESKHALFYITAHYDCLALSGDSE